MNIEMTERLLKNYVNARKSWEGWCDLSNIDLKPEKPDIKKYADNNELLTYVRYLLYKDLHIELYKIIKDSSKTKTIFLNYLGIRIPHKLKNTLKN